MFVFCLLKKVVRVCAYTFSFLPACQLTTIILVPIRSIWLHWTASIRGCGHVQGRTHEWRLLWPILALH